MKNLRLATKMGVIIGVLVLTTLLILWLGYAQQTWAERRLRTLTEVTEREKDHVAAIRAELFNTIRFQRLAIMSDTDEESARAVGKAEEAMRKVNDHRQALGELVERSGVSEDRRSLDEFNRAWVNFQTLQEEILKLAVLNTDIKGWSLLHGKMLDKVTGLEELLLGLAQQAERERADPVAVKDVERIATAEKRERHALRLVALLYDLGRQLKRYLHSSEDTMDLIDTRVATIWRDVDAQAAALTLALGDRGQATADRLSRDIAEIKPMSAQVQKQFRQNTNRRAKELSATTGVKAADACLAPLDKLFDSLVRQVDREVSEHADNLERAQMMILAATVLGVGASVGLAWALTRTITKPMAEGVRLSSEMAQGNLSTRLNLDQHDEVGQLGKALDQMAGNLCGIVCNIRRVSEGITGASEELSRVAHDLTAQSEEMAAQSQQVASGTEQMSTNVSTMAAAAEQVSMNVVSISSASEEISVNVGTISNAAESTARTVEAVVGRIQEATDAFEVIAQDAREGSQVTARAMQMAQQATGTMSELDRAASEINKVTEAIKMIALQTNLLALNATIEATAAGEAGKGFAVVAHEIKELASQSGRAAEDIAHRIEGVQASTRGAVRAIQQMAEIVGSINSTAERISTSVQRQTDNANESVSDLGEAGRGVANIAVSIREVAKGATDMSRNAGEAAKGANDVSRNASEAAQAVREIASNIHGVSGATRQSASSALSVSTSADRLKAIAAELDQIIRRFKTT